MILFLSLLFTKTDITQGKWSDVSAHYSIDQQRVVYYNEEKNLGNVSGSLKSHWAHKCSGQQSVFCIVCGTNNFILAQHQTYTTAINPRRHTWNTFLMLLLLLLKLLNHTGTFCSWKLGLCVLTVIAFCFNTFQLSVWSRVSPFTLPRRFLKFTYWNNSQVI